VPSRSLSHRERHRNDRVGWLRAAVLGANDGIVSTTSLMIGVAATNAARSAILVAGLAGLVAGAASMALGEYVSVSSQRDTEQADIEKERIELEATPEHELEELTQIYVARGLTREFAEQVAEQLTAADALGTHMRDELGIVEHTMARPVQASFVSAISFAVGSIPAIVLMALLGSGSSAMTRIVASAGLALGLLLTLGIIGARIGGARSARAAVRVVIGGAVAMAVAAGIGRLLGTTIS
jgi:VIT1/CCC1 family predicted Fe2+/Mn2+ transporter